jgi:alpha-beta hydrolase superfamily lysophospholipase
MGGAVALLAATDGAPPDVAGTILAAPAVWGRATMPFYQVWLLGLAAHLAPGMTVTGRGLDIWASDNVEMLRGLGRDPLVIKETRVDAVWGLVNLMDKALAAAGSLDARTLVLYGERDEVIPKAAFEAMTERLGPDPDGRRTVALYEDGWHMLLRDLQAETVWRDIAAWTAHPDAPLPSGADRRARRCLDATPPGTCFPDRVGSPLERWNAERADR